MVRVRVEAEAEVALSKLRETRCRIAEVSLREVSRSDWLCCGKVEDGGGRQDGSRLNPLIYSKPGRAIGRR